MLAWTNALREHYRGIMSPQAHDRSVAIGGGGLFRCRCFVFCFPLQTDAQDTGWFQHGDLHRDDARPCALDDRQHRPAGTLYARVGPAQSW